MKIFNINFSIILLFIFFLVGLKIYRNSNINKNIKATEKNKLKNSAEVLNHCFDLKNKSNRNLKDSMKLIDYCLKEYGFENDFKLKK